MLEGTLLQREHAHSPASPPPTPITTSLPTPHHPPRTLQFVMCNIGPSASHNKLAPKKKKKTKRSRLTYTCHIYTGHTSTRHTSMLIPSREGKAYLIPMSAFGVLLQDTTTSHTMNETPAPEISKWYPPSETEGESVRVVREAYPP